MESQGDNAKHFQELLTKSWDMLEGTGGMPSTPKPEPHHAHQAIKACQELLHHRIIELPRLEGTSEDYQVQLFMGREFR